MKRFGWIFSVLLVSGIVYVAAAQPCPMCPGPMGPRPGAGFGNGPGPGMGFGPRREMMRERMMEDGERETIRGRVVSIGPTRRSPGVRMMVEADSRVVPVIIRPMLPLDQLSERIERGDRVEVSGMRTERMGKQVLVATELRVDESGEVIRAEPRFRGGPPMMGERTPFMNDRAPFQGDCPRHPPRPGCRRAV